MIDIIEVNRVAIVDNFPNGEKLVGYNFEVKFLLFKTITCDLNFFIEPKKIGLDVKKYIESILMNNIKNMTQLDGKPSNLKTK